MSETIPADIAAALNLYRQACKTTARRPMTGNAEAEGRAYRALEAAILKHLHGYAGMKAAMDAITSGAA